MSKRARNESATAPITAAVVMQERQAAHARETTAQHGARREREETLAMRRERDRNASMPAHRAPTPGTASKRGRGYHQSERGYRRHEKR